MLKKLGYSIFFFTVFLLSVTCDINNTTYLEKIYKCAYARLGEKNGREQGYLRKGNNPKKICVIGNSITCHGFYEHDGISWTVGDYREMAASRPNSGWVSLVQQYITKNINSDCKVYKANGSVWETGIEGERDYARMANGQVFEVTNTESVLMDGFTIDKMLTEDADIVLVQLGENMKINDVYATSLDFEKLFISIREKCPNAEIYAFVGFWTKKSEVYSIVSACSKTNVNPVFAPNLIPNVVTADLSIYKAQKGDGIYDLSENQIATVSSAVSGHPNDAGFKVIATYFLDSLFNNVECNLDGLQYVYSCDDVEQPLIIETCFISDYL